MSTTDAGPPTVVGGRYTVGDLIGRGGAADVYRARDELLGRDVAIKMFGAGGEVVAAANAEAAAAADDPSPEVADAPAEPDAAPGYPDEGDDQAHDEAPAAVDEHVARYGPGGTDGPPRPSGPPAELVGDLEEGSDARNRREVLTLAALSHPGLVTVYDVGDDHGRAYFVMQLIEGDTLAQRIRRGPLPLGDVIALGAALADALAYVHRRGVVHRDVKPGNVLLDADGRAHLSDFGIAAVRDAAPVTAAGMVIGTASYLSPEQVRGEAVTPAVDIYALGLVLIECLTGRREYPGNALEAAVARLHRRPVVPLGLPESLRSLLIAMTADDPAARPDADEVLAATRAVSRDVGLDAETVLSPALMAAPTGAFAPGPALVAGPGLAGRIVSDDRGVRRDARGRRDPARPAAPGSADRGRGGAGGRPRGRLRAGLHPGAGGLGDRAAPAAGIVRARHPRAARRGGALDRPGRAGPVDPPPRDHPDPRPHHDHRRTVGCAHRRAPGRHHDARRGRATAGGRDDDPGDQRAVRDVDRVERPGRAPAAGRRRRAVTRVSPAGASRPPPRASGRSAAGRRRPAGPGWRCGPDRARRRSLSRARRAPFPSRTPRPAPPRPHRPSARPRPSRGAATRSTRSPEPSAWRSGVPGGSGSVDTVTVAGPAAPRSAHAVGARSGGSGTGAGSGNALASIARESGGEATWAGDTVGIGAPERAGSSRRMRRASSSGTTSTPSGSTST